MMLSTPGTIPRKVSVTSADRAEELKNAFVVDSPSDLNSRSRARPASFNGGAIRVDALDDEDYKEVFESIS
jgi:hypothetical protein